MPGHMMVFTAGVTGVFLGLVFALISLIFRKKENRYGHSSNRAGDDLMAIRRQIAELQAQIDEANKKNALKKARRKARRKVKSNKSASVYDCKNACSSSISSGDDFRTALEDLDTDVSDLDLFEEWGRRNSISENYDQELLLSIDRKLESDPDEFELQKILDQLKDMCYANPENVEILYRIGRVHVALCERKQGDIMKIHVEQGITALSKALTLKNNHAEIHKWYAISIGLRAQLCQTSKEQAKDGLLFKKHCELACALKPHDPVLHHLLGRFDYEIAGLSWFTKRLAGAIIGPMNSTYADALKKFMIAENLSISEHVSTRENRENKTMIAKTLFAMKRRREAEQWLERARCLGRFDDPLDKEISTLLQKYK